MNETVLLLKPEIIDEIIAVIASMNKSGYYFSYKRTEEGENSRLNIYATKPEDFFALGMATQPAIEKYFKTKPR